jgi:g-D-glutamyl-meso-diaminopimelate peptidase
MVNPDGVDLVLNGLQKNNPYYNDLIKWNKGSEDFSKNWSANIRGVDLNHNYDASWEKSKEAEKEYGVFGPGPTRYSGTYPESEPESKAIADFTRKNDFRLVIAYHSQGEVIYWNYMNMATEEAKNIGKLFEKLSGYKLSETYGITSFAGYKDWFIEKYKKPGYTIEVGLGQNPLPIEQFDKIYNDNIKVLLQAATV